MFNPGKDTTKSYYSKSNSDIFKYLDANNDLLYN